MISFVIPTYEKINFTKSCLEDLSKLKINYEVIIVDNSPTDETEKFVKSFDKIQHLTFIKSDKNTFSHACNLGYYLARFNIQFDYVCFLNNDIRVRDRYEDWPVLLTGAADKNYPCMVGDTGGLIDKQGNFVYETRDNQKKFNYISGWNLCLSKEVAKLLEEEEKLWDENIGFYFTETELCFRATQKGIKLIMQNIPVTHFGKISTNKYEVPKLYKEGRQQFLNIAKEKQFVLT